MARSAATTPQGYIDSLPPDRRAALARVRSVVNDNLPGGYREGIAWGAIIWEVPLSVYPDTYNGQPMCYAGLASHKSTATLYLMGAYMDPVLRRRLETGFRAAGKRLDMGKSCLHFKHADDLPLAVIADVIAGMPMDDYIARVEAARSKQAASKARPKPGGAKAPRKAKPATQPRTGSRPAARTKQRQRAR